MSGSFFSSFRVPKANITRVCLLIGVIGIAGLCITGFLVVLSGSQNANSETNQVIEVSIKSSPDILPPSPVGTLSSLISINKGSEQELESLPYIGSKKVTQILQKRPYSSVQEFFQKNSFSKKQQQEIEKLISL